MSRREQPFTMSSGQRRVRYAGRKAVFVVLLAAVVGGLVLADRAGLFGNANQPDKDKYDGQTFTVVKVVDGDTIDIGIADGKRDHTRLRLWGVDTPETKNPRKPGFVGFYGPEASEFVRRQTLNKKVRIELERDKKSRDKPEYNRLLAWVYLPDGRLLNRVLIEQGYGYADPRFPHHLDREFRQLQIDAMNARRGLWVNGPPGDVPYYYKDKSGKLKLPTK